LSACMTDLGQVDDALKEAHEARRLAPRLPLAIVATASALSKKGRYADALSAYREVLELQPRNATIYASAAFALNNLGKPGEALAMADRGLEISPNAFGNLNARALALLGLRRTAEARETLRAALVSDPQRSVLHQNLAIGFLHRGDAESARESLREALRLDPTNAAAARMLNTHASSTGGVAFARISRAFYWWNHQAPRTQAWLIAVVAAASIVWLGFLTTAAVLTITTLRSRAGGWRSNGGPVGRLLGAAIVVLWRPLYLSAIFGPVFASIALRSVAAVGGPSFLAFLVLVVSEPSGWARRIGIAGAFLMGGAGVFSTFFGTANILFVPTIFGYLALLIPGGDSVPKQLPPGPTHPWASPDERNWYG